MSKIRFTKMHGCGNDYIYVDTMRCPIADPEVAARQWSDRHTGIGADGLVLIGRATVAGADFSMRIFNADGSEGMMCGNASRCIGKYLYERALTGKEEIRLQTLSGIKTLHLTLATTPDGGSIVEKVSVDMGEPVFDDRSLFLPEMAAFLPETGDDAMFVSMGNPHYVIFTDNINQVDEIGPAMERRAAFPRQCNIELAHPTRTPDTLRLRVWERGSGITQACGTGACATAVAAAMTGRCGRRQQIEMDGGTLNIFWNPADNHVYMEGPATFVYDGEIELENIPKHPNTQTTKRPNN